MILKKLNIKQKKNMRSMLTNIAKAAGSLKGAFNQAALEAGAESVVEASPRLLAASAVAVAAVTGGATIITNANDNATAQEMQRASFEHDHEKLELKRRVSDLEDKLSSRRSSISEGESSSDETKPKVSDK